MYPPSLYLSILTSIRKFCFFWLYLGSNENVVSPLSNGNFREIQRIIWTGISPFHPPPPALFLCTIYKSIFILIFQLCQFLIWPLISSLYKWHQIIDFFTRNKNLSTNISVECINISNHFLLLKLLIHHHHSLKKNSNQVKTFVVLKNVSPMGKRG